MSADKRNGIIAIINMYHHSSEFAIIILPINTATIIILLIMVNFLSSHLAIDDPCCMRKNIKIKITPIKMILLKKIFL